MKANKNERMVLMSVLLVMVLGLAGDAQAIIPDSNRLQTPPAGNRETRSTTLLIDSAAKVIKTNPKLSKELLDQAYQIAQASSDSLGLYRYWHLQGVIESFAGEHSKALKNFLNALEICRLNNDTSAISHTYNNLGILMEKLNQIEKSKNYYNMAMSSYRLLGDNDGVAACLNNLGNIYQSVDSVETALDYYYRAIDIEKQEGDSLKLGNLYGNLGNLYRKTNQYILSERYYRKGMDVFYYLQDTASIARSHLNLAVLYRKQDKINPMRTHLTKGHQMANHANEYALMVLYCEIFSETYADLGDYEKAYQWRIRYEEAHEKFMNKENSRQINELQVKYETKNKVRQIELLKKEKELKEFRIQQQSMKLKRAEMQFLLAIAFITLLLISGYLLIRSNRLKQMAKFDREKIKHRDEQIKTIIHTQEAERNRFAKDIHDGLGQYLTALKMSIINYYSHHKPSAAAHSAGYDTMMERFDEIYQELRNITFNIMPRELHKKGLTAATERLVEQWNRENCRIQFFSYGLTGRLSSSKEIAIYRIVQEIINNAIKHSASNILNITYTEHDNALNIMTEFNGKGFDPAHVKQSQGSGWKNILSRLEMMEGTVEIDSAPARNNSTIIIDIPIP